MFEALQFDRRFLLQESYMFLKFNITVNILFFSTKSFDCVKGKRHLLLTQKEQITILC